MKKRILIVTRSFAKGGGVSRSAAILGNNLFDKNYDVIHLTFSKDCAYNIKGKHYSLNEEYYLLNEAKGFKNFMKNIKNVLRSLIFVNPKIIKNFSENFKIDLIISFGEFNNLPVLLSKLFYNNKRKIIVSIRNNPDKKWAKANSIKSILLYLLFNFITVKNLYKKADGVVPLSKILEIKLIKYGINKDKIKTIHNFYDIESHIDLSKREIPQEHKDIFNNAFIFINIGSLDQRKAQIPLIKSFKKVVDNYENVKLLIIGDGYLKNQIEYLIKKLNLKTKVHLIGEQSNVFPFLKNANCFILNSLYEGFPNVIIEALSIDLPIISRDCKYGPRFILCPELDLMEKISYPYYGNYGVLIRDLSEYNSTTLSNKESDLSTMMLKIINDNSFYKKYCKGKNRAYDFKIEKIINQWEKYILTHID